MIKNNLTISGKNVSDLTFSSKEKINRICDLCGEIGITTWNTIARCRKKHNTTLDYCFSCSMRIYNSGNKNPAKRIEVRKKILESSLGKSKKFKDGKNFRILDRKISVNGYALKWLDGERKHILEHRLVYAEANNLNHDELNSIHHLDGNKMNNNINNLIELNESEHGALHSQLESLALKLVQDNIIIFNKITKKYELNSNVLLNTMERSFGFEDIAIKQKKNICQSRLDVDISSEIIRGVIRPNPMIASNMSTVVNADFCIQLFKNGALGIMHRADTEQNILNEIKKISKECEWVAGSIGVGADQLELANKMIKNGCNIITIDVAHGFSDTVLELGKKIKQQHPFVKLIIGNTTNPDIFKECYDFVDAIKVGIAQGLACETKNTAGCTEKQFSAVLKFKQLSKNFGIPIISDGGIREPADFSKSIAAGANSIMAGSIFARCPESAAELKTIYSHNGSVLSEQKIYAGMASRYVQEKWKGKLKDGTCPEGGIRYLELGEPLNKLLERYSGALKSGITYAGGNSISTFQNSAEFVLLK